MKVVQILPELNAGGVERGTLEIAAALVAAGHESVVVSNGGRLVEELEQAGSKHITMPVHRKSLSSLAQVKPMRRLLEELKPDIVHIRSRVPGWITWLAWRKMDPATRPKLVSTVHGFYSTNFYSAVMTKGERVIAVSKSIRDYILKYYPKTDASIIRVIHRGVEPPEADGLQPEPQWLATWRKEQPQIEGKQVLLLPGRITRWKGQRDFIRLVAELKKQGRKIHGLIAGETHPKKQKFMDELRELVASLDLYDDITFLGHRSDVRSIMQVSDIVLSLSLDPEAFGRVSLEAMAVKRPVVAYDHGGVAEQLAVMLPGGRVPVGDIMQLVTTVKRMIDEPETPSVLAPEFTLDAMCNSTLNIYQELTS